MPKRKKEKLETIDELIEEVQAAEGNITKELEPQLDVEPSQRDINKKRDELLKLAQDGELDKSVAYIKKASTKIIEKLYIEYERKRMVRANEFLTDVVISKFSDVLGGFDAIEDSEVLTNDLKKDELLKRDVYSLVEKLTPFLPFIGILSGGVTTAKHIYDHKSKTPTRDEGGDVE